MGYTRIKSLIYRLETRWSSVVNVDTVRTVQVSSPRVPALISYSLASDPGVFRLRCRSGRIFCESGHCLKMISVPDTIRRRPNDIFNSRHNSARKDSCSRVHVLRRSASTWVNTFVDRAGHLIAPRIAVGFFVLYSNFYISLNFDKDVRVRVLCRLRPPPSRRPSRPL